VGGGVPTSSGTALASPRKVHGLDPATLNSQLPALYWHLQKVLQFTITDVRQ
jgi:hypothetical protein